MAIELSGLRDLFNKSLVLTEDVSSGTVLQMRHVTAKKPGTGITVDRLDEVLGRRLARDISADSFLSEADLDETGEA